MSKTGAKIVERTEMLSITSPDHVARVDKANYDAMKRALLAAIPAGEPGLTVAEIKARALPLLPEAPLPGGAQAGGGLRGCHPALEPRVGPPPRATQPLWPPR